MLNAVLRSAYLTKPIVLSILFHLFVVTATMVGWPFLVKPTPTAQQLIIVDIVKLAPKTNLSEQAGKAKASPEPEKEATRRKPPPPPPAAPPSPAVEPRRQPRLSLCQLPSRIAETAEILPAKSLLPKPKPHCVELKPKAAAKRKTVNIKTPLSRPKRPERPKQKQVGEAERLE